MRRLVTFVPPIWGLMFGKRLFPVALILLSIALLSTENLTHYPVGLMCLLGLYYAAREPRAVFSTPGARLVTTVFACIFIPMLLSLPDAVAPSRALKTSVAYLHFLPAALYITYMLRDPQTLRTVLYGVSFIVAFWCIDGIVQLLFGRDLFGYPYEGAVLTGSFYPKQRFGLILAVLAPIYLYVVHRIASRNTWAWLALLPFIIIIIFSLKRTAWLMLVVGLVGFLACFFEVKRKNLRSVAMASGFMVLALTLSIAAMPVVKTQFNNTLKIFSADFKIADRATSYRLSLWTTGWAMAREHWLNGIGPRGFRSAYLDFAPVDDFWIKRGNKGQTHPHLMGLEVFVETGVIGALGYTVALMLLIRALSRCRAREPVAAVFFLVVVVAWFPLNAHLAFYGSYWSNIAWIVLGLASAAHAPQQAT